jgi:hypothetical protein
MKKQKPIDTISPASASDIGRTLKLSSRAKQNALKAMKQAGVYPAKRTSDGTKTLDPITGKSKRMENLTRQEECALERERLEAALAELAATNDALSLAHHHLAQYYSILAGRKHRRRAREAS